MRIPPFVRRWLDPVTERIPVPVIGGVNRGRWWSLVSAGGYATGGRAEEQMAVLRDLISPGDVVWDVGAHHGYMTLLAAARVQPGGWVYTFEPGGKNRRILERHIRWNRLGNVSVQECALASYDGTARFGGGTTSKMHTLGGGEEEVAVCTGETLVRSGAVRAPTFVKIDVEGAEADVLAGALSILSPRVVMLVAIHSAAADEECTALLQAHGFALHPSRALERARRTRWRGDADLLCVGPDHHDDGRITSLLESGYLQHDEPSPRRG